MKNILVTGGAGFIGANFVRTMLEKNNSVFIVNLDALTYAGSLNNLEKLPDAKRHLFIRGDICDLNLIKKILRDHQIDTIVHFAAESHVDNSISGPEAFVQTNIVGTFNLLEAAREINCRFHHVSTDEVFGALLKDEPAFTEKSRYLPSSPYSASKAGSDHLVRAFHHTYQLPVSISHCSNNYGPFQHAEKLIPTIIRACRQRKKIPIYGDGSNVRDWLFVQDHCEGILKILQKGKIGETYNLGGNFEISNLHVAKIICQHMDELFPDKAPHEKLIEFVKDRPGHDWRYAMDISKISEELDWQPKVGFDEGMRKTIGFFCGF